MPARSESSHRLVGRRRADDRTLGERAAADDDAVAGRLRVCAPVRNRGIADVFLRCMVRA